MLTIHFGPVGENYSDGLGKLMRNSNAIFQNALFTSIFTKLSFVPRDVLIISYEDFSSSISTIFIFPK